MLSDTDLGMGVDATGQKYIPHLLRVAGNFPIGQRKLLWNDSFSVCFILFSFLLSLSGMVFIDFHLERRGEKKKKASKLCQYSALALAFPSLL